MITRAQYMTGKVRRWHTHHALQQTNADHSWGVALILLKIVRPEPSQRLLAAAILHDTGEYLAGDVPGFTKRRHIGVADAMELAEKEAQELLGLQMPSLDDKERLWLKLADAIEAWLFIRHCGQFTPDEVMEWFPAISDKMNEAALELGIDLDATLREVRR